MLVDEMKHDTTDELWDENDEHRDHSNIYLFIKFDVVFLCFLYIHSIENYTCLDTYVHSVLHTNTLGEINVDAQMDTEGQ